MAESLRGGLSLTSSGFAFWSHDIGGFEVSCEIPRERALDTHNLDDAPGTSSTRRIQTMGCFRPVLISRA